jgi:hypothetical protein
LRLKTAIQLIVYSNRLLIGGLILGAVAAFRHSEGVILFLEISFIAILGLAYFFRMVLINRYLKSCKYPAVFLGVLSRFNLSQDFDINWSDQAAAENFRPPYSTDEFLGDNKLSAEIGEKQTDIPFYMPFIFLAAGGYALYQKSSYSTSIAVICAVVFVLAMVLKKQKNKPDPFSIINVRLRFTKEGLALPEGVIDWKDIFTWTLAPGSHDDPGGIVIEYYGAQREISTKSLYLPELGADKIDLLILLEHFKAKYGQQ